VSKAAAMPRSETGRMPAGVRTLLLRPEAPALIFLVLLAIVLAFSAEGFLDPANLEDNIARVVVLGVIALGVNQVVLSGEIDISVGSMLGLCAFAVGAVGESQGGLILPLLAGIGTGVVAGSVNGALVTLGRIPSIIVTLGMLYALRGMILVITGGRWITNIPSDTRALGLQSVAGVSVPVIILVVLLVVVELISRNSTWGRNVFAVGGNRRAARFAGLSAGRTRFLAFVLVGVLTGIAAAIYVGRAGGVQTNAGQGLELQVVAAVVVGGTSISGGRGSSVAAITGAVLIGVILNGLVLLDVPAEWQSAMLGALILLAISTDALRRRLLREQPS